jgi:hypothetical protein
MVTGTGPDAVSCARVALERVGYHTPNRQENVAVAVVDSLVASRRRAARRLHQELGLDARRIVSVPHDHGLTASSRFEPATLRPSTRRAYVGLAALLSEDPRPGPQGKGQ